MLAVVSLLVFLQPPELPRPERPNSCGLASCYLFLQSVNGSANWDTLAGDFSDESGESSFLDLKRSLNHHGVDVIAIDTDLTKLKALRRPAIVQSFLDGKDKKRFPHFLVLVPHEDSMLLLDPMMGKPVLLSEDVEEVFAQQFTGKALVESSAMSSRGVTRTLLLGSAWGVVVIAFGVWCRGLKRPRVG